MALESAIAKKTIPEKSFLPRTLLYTQS